MSVTTASQLRPRNFMTVLYESPGVCFAHHHNFFVHIWRDTIKAEDLRRFGEVRQQIDPKYPQGTVGMVVMCKGLSIPSSAAREEGIKLAKIIDHSTLCVGVVMEETGLLASTVRTVVSGVAIAARSTYQTKFFQNTESCADWIQPQLDRSRSPGAISLKEIQKIRHKVMTKDE